MTDFSPSSGGGNACAPLQLAPADRVNHQREPSAMLSSLQAAGLGGQSSRDSSVHEKISQFNTLAVQSKHLERKTADAALKRAMLGREEAEAEMRRCRDEIKALRDEVRTLRSHAEEGSRRERKVGERLENVMESYGRAKETHAHTQALWEKEIRRARKETFKSQSIIVKLQEELKSARLIAKAAEEALAAEKERSAAREQEAFAARYSMVGLQEQLEQAQERVRVVEQERDAFKTLAKTEEDVARIAAEGRLPLPRSCPSDDGGEPDEFASPKKKTKEGTRVLSLSAVDVKSSSSGEAEFEELALLWSWEKRRADRALEHVEYLEAECHLRACVCMKSRPRNVTIGESRPDVGESVFLSEKSPISPPKSLSSPKKLRLEALKSKSEPRRSTIFVPEEGVFRTVSQEEAEARAAPSIPAKESPVTEEVSMTDPMTPSTQDDSRSPVEYLRTPSAEPPSCATFAHPRASLLSLLDAPHQRENPLPINFNIPIATVPISQGAPQDALTSEMELTPRPQPDFQPAVTREAQPRPPEPDTPTATGGIEVAVMPVTPATQAFGHHHEHHEFAAEEARPTSHVRDFALEHLEEPVDAEHRTAESAHPPRPHTSAAHYIKTTTTKVPLREETKEPSMAARLMALQRTPVRGDEAGPCFDVNNPALTPTMTREQALAQIRERRGRARSAMAGAVTPKRQPALGERRDVSAPVSSGRPAGAGAVGSVRRGARTA